MRIFLTGATGYIGSAVLDALLRANHHVTALVRTPQACDALTARGVTPLVGDLKNLQSYRAGAEGFDAYVHTAAEPGVHREDVDRKAIETLLAAAAARAGELAGGAAFVYTSGIWVLGSNAQPMDESAQTNPGQLLGWRPIHEQLVLQSAGKRLRTCVVRPGVVYGGSRGLVSELLKNAMNGLIRVIGPGDNHWPLVYQRDLADLYLRAATRPEATGIYHANDEADETVNVIVDSIASHCTVRPDVRHVPLGEARKKFGAYADALALDQIVRGPRARALGWAPSLHSVTANVPRLLEEFRRDQEQAA
jgi:nucleoside-diphosphate-sugar epimerase